MSVRAGAAIRRGPDLSLGQACTVLVAMLYARRHGGVSVLRIEDGPGVRESNAVLEALAWLGLDYDEGPFRTPPAGRYREVLDQLQAAGHAYRCECPGPVCDRGCRDRSLPPGSGRVLRLRGHDPGGEFADLVQGAVRLALGPADDPVLATADGRPGALLRGAVDDLDQRISHAFRPHARLAAAPHEACIHRLLGAEPPRYGHLCELRRAGAAEDGVLARRAAGYLPEAILVALLRRAGCRVHPGPWPAERLAASLDLAAFAGAVLELDDEELERLNVQCLRGAEPEHVARRLSWHLARAGVEPAGEPALSELIAVLRRGTRNLVDLAAGCAPFYREAVFPPPGWLAALEAGERRGLELARRALEALDRWSAPALDDALVGVAEEVGVAPGRLDGALRVALGLEDAATPVELVLELLGRDRVLARLTRVLGAPR
jgi:glutamyl-tRNA synthetase